MRDRNRVGTFPPKILSPFDGFSSVRLLGREVRSQVVGVSVQDRLTEEDLAVCPAGTSRRCGNERTTSSFCFLPSYHRNPWLTNSVLQTELIVGSEVCKRDVHIRSRECLLPLHVDHAHTRDIPPFRFRCIICDLVDDVEVIIRLCIVHEVIPPLEEEILTLEVFRASEHR